MTEHPPESAARRRLSDRELTQLQETGRVKTLGGFTFASLIASLNELGLGPEDVEVAGCGEANKYGVELWVITPDDDDEGWDEND